ncbi:MAG: hypothetical protein FWC72_07485 [Oscillospiraceae bacterium]|nr:hypothetical protein [Oscillospiraceae bacterium]
MSRIFRVCFVVLLYVAALGVGLSACGEAEPHVIDSLTFTLDGVEYTMPVLAGELMANGWELTEDAILYPGNTYSQSLRRAFLWLPVSFFNFSEEALPLSESYVDRIFCFSLSAILFQDSVHDTQTIFPGNIMVGSTYDEVIAAYGEPGERRNPRFMISADYDVDLVWSTNYAAMVVQIDTETNLVSNISLYYLGRNPDTGDIPATVLAYEAPRELGDDWRDFTVRIDGDLYRLPAPVAAFAENDWGPGAPQPHATVNPGTEERSALFKDGRVLAISRHNPDDVIRPETHTFVTEIRLSLTRPESSPPFELPGGIDQNATLEEVIAAFGTPDDIYETNGVEYGRDGIRVYVFGVEDEGIRVEVAIETGEILAIFIRYRPESLR